MGGHGRVYDKIIIGNKTFDFVKGVENFRSKLKSYFPKDSIAIDKYIELVFKANKAMKKFYLEKTLPNFLSSLFGFFLRKPYLKYTSKTTHEVLNSITKNKELIKVLTAVWDYGLPPKVVSPCFGSKTLLKAVVFSWGSSQIVKAIDPVMKTQWSN